MALIWNQNFPIQPIARWRSPQISQTWTTQQLICCKCLCQILQPRFWTLAPTQACMKTIRLTLSIFSRPLSIWTNSTWAPMPRSRPCWLMAQRTLSIWHFQAENQSTSNLTTLTITWCHPIPKFPRPRIPTTPLKALITSPFMAIILTTIICLHLHCHQLRPQLDWVFTQRPPFALSLPHLHPWRPIILTTRKALPISCRPILDLWSRPSQCPASSVKTLTDMTPWLWTVVMTAPPACHPCPQWNQLAHQDLHPLPPWPCLPVLIPEFLYRDHPDPWAGARCKLVILLHSPGRRLWDKKMRILLISLLFKSGLRSCNKE